MRAAAARSRRAQARLGDAARAIGRRVPPSVRAPLSKWFEPQLGRVRRAATTPHWYEIGRELAAEGRDREAAEAFLTAAERGQVLRVLTLTMHTHSVREIMAEEANVERIRRIGLAQPASVDTQLFVGTFLLDHGLVDEGAAATRRGFELLYGTDPSSPIDPTGSSRGPDYLILGPPKTGTTSLHALLAVHPNVVKTFRKELYFFTHRHERPLECYDAYFPVVRPGFATGEACPLYARHAPAAETVAQHYPRTKVVIMRRDPVARAFSHYQMERRSPFETRSPEEAFGDELASLGDTAPLHPADLPPGSPFLTDSCILPFVRMWVEALGEERVRVIDSTALLQHRQAVLDAVLDFLGLPSYRAVSFENRNVHEYAPIPTALERRLRDWFAPHEVALDEFVAEHPAVLVAAT